MILNAYAVLDLAMCLLRAGLAAAVLWLAVGAWWTWAEHRMDADRRKRLEDRTYLVFLLAGVLLALNVAAWPILYLLLQSYVPEWPGVMCVYGVTRIGTGSIGPSRFLPALVVALQLLKPAVIFLSGAWFVVYLVNRRTQSAPLTGRVLTLLAAAGLLALADASTELAYLAIPKTETFLAAGCCTEAFDLTGRESPWSPGYLMREQDSAWWWSAYYSANLSMIVGLAAIGRRYHWRPPLACLAVLAPMAVLAAAVNGVFLVDIAAPRLLHLPWHRCPYDLIPKVPESQVAIVLFVAGTFGVGWAGVASLFGRDPETRTQLRPMVGRLLRLALVAYVASVVMASVELALA